MLNYYCFYDSFPLKNTGKVVLSYKWYVIKEVEGAEPVMKDAAKEDEMEELLIQIDPYKGEIPPEQEQMIAVKYSPLEIGSILYKLHCKYVNHCMGTYTVHCTYTSAHVCTCSYGVHVLCKNFISIKIVFLSFSII